MYHEFSTTVVEYSHLLRLSGNTEGHNYDHLITKLTDTIASSTIEPNQGTISTTSSTIREGLLTQLYTINADDFSALLEPKLLALCEHYSSESSGDVTPALGPETDFGKGLRTASIDGRFNTFLQVYKGTALLILFVFVYTCVITCVYAVHYIPVRALFIISGALFLFLLIDHCCCHY